MKEQLPKFPILRTNICRRVEGITRCSGTLSTSHILQGKRSFWAVLSFRLESMSDMMDMQLEAHYGENDHDEKEVP